MSKKFNDPKGAAGAVKTPLGLIPPHAMEQTAWVHKLGADKYGPWNWRETGVCASTYVNAILRHLNAWRDGEDLDPESGISHLAHVACSANILMDAGYCGKLQDDRNTTRQCNEVEEAYDDWGSLDEEKEDLRVKLLKSFFKLDKYAETKVADCDLEETCDSKSEPQVECDCGRRYVYHWLYGWICEDCDIKYPDPQP